MPLGKKLSKTHDSQSKKHGILLINLGTPDAPEPAKVGKYLRQFLMDPFVIPLPWLLRWILVNIIIVPRRKYKSAENYKKIWGPTGSPLLVHSVSLFKKIKERLAPFEVGLAMRYGRPGIKEVVTEMAPSISSLTVLPLYPQFADSTVKTSIVSVQNALNGLGANIPVDVFPAFYDKEFYLIAMRDLLASHLPAKVDTLLFSFHGLPEKYLTKECGPGHCLASDNCCESYRQKAPNCYRAQCLDGAKLIMQDERFANLKYEVAFQSRLGRDAWIKPYLEPQVINLAKSGTKNLVVACPSFVSDCLETLEEVGLSVKKTFLQNGGESFHLIPCLNDDPVWVDQLSKVLSNSKR